MRTATAVTAGDSVWIGAALLHRDQPGRADFDNAEIKARVVIEPGLAHDEATLDAHLSRQAVANKEPKPAALRLLYATGHGRRRLFRPGDDYDRGREGPTDQGGTRTHPRKEDIPARFGYLVDWYLDEYAAPRGGTDPLLALAGIGRRLAGAEHPDDHVRRLRESWQ